MKKLKSLLSIAVIQLIFVSFLSGLSFAAPENDRNREQKVAFNFVDVDLGAITKFISEITKKNFIFDDRVKGKITIITPTKLNIDDAFNLFVSVLELKGFTVVPSGVDAYKIIPSVEAKQKGIKVMVDRQPVNDSYIVRLIKLKNIPPDDAMKLLQPVVSKDGYISAFGPGNMLLVIDSGSNIEKVLSIINAVDQPYLLEEPDIVFLKHASADAVARIITEGLSRGGRPQQAAGAGEAKSIADARLNAVVLFGDRGMRESMKSLINLLDVPSPEAQGRINVFFLENADAVELSKVLQEMLKGTQLTHQTAAGTQGAPVAPFEAGGGITITADKATNSLVVVASYADYQNLVYTIKKLDRRRRQVFVEAMIAEVSLNGLIQLGTNFRVSAQQNGNPVFIGGAGQISQTTLQNIVTGLSGLTLGGIGKYFTIPQSFIPGATSAVQAPGLAAIFQLSDFKDVVNVISTPQILTSDNKAAEILVGQNVPFIASREQSIATSGTVINDIQRQDVGVKLQITPQITEGDYVKLDIYQEISSLEQADDTILTSVGPTIDKRSTKTSVVVKDGDTVVIGGLMSDSTENSITKAPVIGDIPILGWLFKTKSVTKTKTDLLVFITPHLLKKDESLAQITKDKRNEFMLGERELGEQESATRMNGEIFVKFKVGVPAEKALQLLSEKGLMVIGYSGSTNVYRIKVKEGVSVNDAIKELSEMPEVVNSGPDNGDNRTPQR
jgi:general secretion pathway protein D